MFTCRILGPGFDCSRLQSGDAQFAKLGQTAWSGSVWRQCIHTRTKAVSLQTHTEAAQEDVFRGRMAARLARLQGQLVARAIKASQAEQLLMSTSFEQCRKWDF